MHRENYVCICRLFVFLSVVVTVWGYVGMFCCVATVVKDNVFEPWSVEVCSMFL